MNITEISINRPSLIIVLFSVLTLLGIIGYTNLDYELMPDFNQPVIVVKTGYPGAGPSEVENAVSIKIEEAISNLEGIDYISTKSLPNASVIIVNLKYGTSLDQTLLDAQRFIGNIRKDLPDNILEPELSKISPNDLPVITISATSNLDPTQFYTLIKENVIPRMSQIKGVAEITMLGGKEREFQVLLNREKLLLYKISLTQITEAIKRSGMDIPGGNVTNKQYDAPVRIVGRYTTLDNIKNCIVLIPQSGSPVFLKDLAEIKDDIKPVSSFYRFNGNEGIGILIKKQGDANAVEVSKNIRNTIQQIEHSNKNSGVHLSISEDNTDYTISAVNAVVADLLMAVILVALVMLVFLKSFRNALIVMVAIPASLITAFSVMWLMDYTLNLMTLLAMSLIIGILVDDATVVLENIQSHLDRGKNKKQAALDGRNEIGFSALSITLVDVVVFLPVLFIQVFVADLLKQFSVVVVTSTLTSLLVGFTLTPWLASRVGKKEEVSDKGFLNKILFYFDQKIEALILFYKSSLYWVLKHSVVFSLIVIILFVITGLIMKLGISGKELISAGDQGRFRLVMEMDKSVSILYNDSVSKRIEQYILSDSSVSDLLSNVGGASTGIGSLGMGSKFKSEFTVQLRKNSKNQSFNTTQYMIQLKEKLAREFTGMNFSMSVIGLIPRSAPVEFTLSGNDDNLVMATAYKLKKYIASLPGADHVQLSREEGTTEYTIIPDKIKMQLLGINTALTGQNIRTAFYGNEEVTLTENGIEYPVRVWLGEDSRKNYNDISRFPVINQQGYPIEINQFASVIQENSPSLLERKDRMSAITLTSEALGIPSGTLADKVVAYLKNNPLPEGIFLTWGSDIKRQQDSFGALGYVLIISFVLIYLILVALYNSFIYPMVALFSIPMAIIGALWALNLSLNHISIFVLLGLIMLMGLVVKNAILIVDFINHIKKENHSLENSIILASQKRLRPILMTTLSMIIGMLPIALAQGTASEWKNGLAWVIIGGLTSSLILTIYLVPLIYYWVDKFKMRFKIS